MSAGAFRRAKDARDRGAILINALLILTLLAATSAALQLRTTRDILRMQARADAAQSALYLDSAMALAALALRLDGQTTKSDHPGETWARRDIVVPIDRGVISVVITDLQSLPNLNALADPDDPFGARAGFLRQRNDLGLSGAQASAIIAHVQERGALIAPEDLRDIPSLSGQVLQDLLPRIAILPGNPAINVNTASRAFLSSLFPKIDAQKWDEFLAQRSEEPLPEVKIFGDFLSQHMSKAEFDAINLRRFDVKSAYFGAMSTVALDKHRWSRQTWLHRNKDHVVRRFYQARVY